MHAGAYYVAIYESVNWVVLGDFFSWGGLVCELLRVNFVYTFRVCYNLLFYIRINLIYLNKNKQ
jgi:hypothetical protein